MKKGCLDVKVLHIPIEGHSDMQECMERLKTCHRGSGLVIVNQIALCKALGDIAYFIPRDVAHIISFPLTDELSF